MKAESISSDVVVLILGRVLGCIVAFRTGGELRKGAALLNKLPI
jgi:hypothetical protein